jgi:hypothetical protein
VKSKENIDVLCEFSLCVARMVLCERNDLLVRTNTMSVMIERHSRILLVSLSMVLYEAEDAARS